VRPARRRCENAAAYARAALSSAAAAVEDHPFNRQSLAILSIEGRSTKSRITYRKLVAGTSGFESQWTAFFRTHPVEGPGRRPMTGKPVSIGYERIKPNVALSVAAELDRTVEPITTRIRIHLGTKWQWRIDFDGKIPQVVVRIHHLSRLARSASSVRLQVRGRESITRLSILADCFKGTESNPAYDKQGSRKKSRLKVSRNIILQSEWRLLPLQKHCLATSVAASVRKATSLHHPISSTRCHRPPRRSPTSFSDVENFDLCYDEP